MLIYCVSMTCKRAITILDDYAETFAMHLVRCIVFGKSLGESNYKHWVEEEICKYLADANDMCVKPSNQKLKHKDYLDTIFSMLGDSAVDARLVLRHFSLGDGKHYPKFEIDDALINRTYQVFQKVISEFTPLLASKNNLSSEDFANKMYTILE